MEVLSIIILSLLISILVGICITWLYFLFYMIKSLIRSPKLEYVQIADKKFPLISIILPARNEEKHIRNCIDSLLKQDYSNFEIILVDDESTDMTLTIMKEFEKLYPNKIKAISITNRDENWIGKNWACYQGYLQSKGSFLLFTDADSIHSPKTMTLAVQNIIHDRLDAITVMPMLLCNDLLTKVTLPILATFMHTRFSPLKVNSNKSKLGYFFGSYYIISRETYEKIGSHKSVKHEIIEDGALGKKVKESKFRMKMVRGENYVTAIWARNSRELLNAIDRLVIPIFKENKLKGSLLSIFLFFFLMFPILLFPFSLNLTIADISIVNVTISLISGSTIILLLITNLIQIHTTLSFSKLYSLGFVMGSIIIVTRFMNKFIRFNTKSIIRWRDREYELTPDQTFSL